MTDDEKWNAVAENDERYDGVFYYAVKTTGLFCRPSCRSKLPLRENVEYFDCVQDALAAGYKICKRCRPDLMEYRPEREIAQKMKEIIEQYFNLRVALQKQIRELGLSEHRITEIFKEEYGVTPFEYANRFRLEEAKERLLQTNEAVIDIAYSTGFESVTTFYRTFRKYTGTSPARFRKEMGEKR